MRQYLVITLFVVTALYFGSCKKCYQCQDTCKKCVLMSGSLVIATQVICTDSFSSIPAFNAAVAADSAMGYVCTATGSSYNKNFCANKPGEQDYLNYYNQGGMAVCTVK